MSVAILSSAPGAMTRASSSNKPGDTSRRFTWRFLGQGSGNRMKTRRSEASGSQRSSSRASSALRRTLASACSSIADSALTTPSSNTSQPIKPTSGLWRACQMRCSAPPNPISSHTADGRNGEQCGSRHAGTALSDRAPRRGSTSSKSALLARAQLAPAPAPERAQLARIGIRCEIRARFRQRPS